MRLELTRSKDHYPLKVARLPFRHSRGNGASERNRTVDTRIFSPLLYQLSYGTKYVPYLKFGEVPFFSFGITKVGIFSYTPNFSCTFFNIFSKFFHAYTITHYPSGNCPETLFLTFFCHHQTQICNLETTLSNINSNNQKQLPYFSSRTQRT